MPKSRNRKKRKTNFSISSMVSIPRRNQYIISGNKTNQLLLSTLHKMSKEDLAALSRTNPIRLEGESEQSYRDRRHTYDLYWKNRKSFAPPVEDN